MIHQDVKNYEGTIQKLLSFEQYSHMRKFKVLIFMTI